MASLWEWWCYRKIAMSVLNFWLIFGSYHSIHMVGGQEKRFLAPSLPIDRLMEQNRWFFTNIGSSRSAVILSGRQIVKQQAGTICGTFVQHKSGPKFFVLFVFLRFATKTSFFGLFATKMLQPRIFIGKMLFKLNKENTLWHPVFHLKTIVCAG